MCPLGSVSSVVQAEPDSGRSVASVCVRWLIRSSASQGALLWGHMALWAQLSAAPRGLRAGRGEMGCGQATWGLAQVHGARAVAGPGGGRPGHSRSLLRLMLPQRPLALWFHRAAVQPWAVCLSQWRHPVHPPPLAV